MEDKGRVIKVKFKEERIKTKHSVCEIMIKRKRVRKRRRQKLRGWGRQTKGFERMTKTERKG